MARVTGKPAVCGTCPHTYDVAVTVTIRVPEPSGGFRIMSATKEIDCVLTSQSMTDAQYKRFLPHRTAMAESKAFMRAIRAALGLAGTYNLDDLKKPFIVARIVPNLDAPEIKNAVANSYLQSMGLLFEMPDAKPQIAAPAQPKQVVQPFPDEDGMTGSEFLMRLSTAILGQQTAQLILDISALKAKETDFDPILNVLTSAAFSGQLNALTMAHMPGMYAAWLSVME